MIFFSVELPPQKMDTENPKALELEQELEKPPLNIEVGDTNIEICFRYSYYKELKLRVFFGHSTIYENNLNSIYDWCYIIKKMTINERKSKKSKSEIKLADCIEILYKYTFISVRTVVVNMLSVDSLEFYTLKGIFKIDI